MRGLIALFVAACPSLAGQPLERGKVATWYYRCEMDDTDQPYSVWLPRDYSPDRKWPLAVQLHGLGGNYRIGGPPRELEDWVVVAPDGRGNTDYKLWGELDVVRVVHEVKRRLSIDADRVALYGFSMGGSGSWQVGVHFPDLFAALGPVCGNADHRVWEREWKWGERNPNWMSPKKAWVEATESPAFFAENLVNLPSWPIHGDMDNVVPCGHSRSMAAELTKAGAECHYMEVPGAGHGVPGDKVAEMLNWLKTQKRDPWPKRVVFKTAWRRHPGAYWVRIHRFERAFAFARIEAEMLDKASAQVRADNVEEFALRLVPPLVEAGRPIRVTVNGRDEYQGQAPADGWLRLRKEGDRWRPSSEPEGLHKTPELEGPVQHAFMSSFVIVHGTQGDDDRAKRAAAEEARTLADRWNRWSRGKCRTKADRDVTDDDIARHSLILVGDPATNSLVPRVMPSLPIRVEGKHIAFGNKGFEGDDLGLKLIYPNPLNPKRYVVLFTGTTWQGVHQIVGRFGNWFDWGILDGYHWADFEVFDDHTYSPETCLAVGYFDNDWRLSPDWMVLGDEKLRLARPPRKLPMLRQPPDDAAEMFLSDLEPAHANIEKGAVAYDRSFNAFPLTLGGRTFARGLGVHSNCDLAWDLGGRFSTFEAVVGADLEDEPVVSEARDKAETFEFMVIGDGRTVYQTGRMRWNSPPRHIYVPIAGVRRLELKIHRRSGPRWLSGPVDWALARVGEPIYNRIAVRAQAGRGERLAESRPLDGAWRLAGFPVGEGITHGAHRAEAEAQREAIAAEVPSSVYAALDAQNRKGAPNQEWWYWHEFDVPRNWAGRSVWIELDGAAYQADCWLNGRWVGRTVGAFAQGRFDATQGVRLGQKNAVAIRVTSSPAEWAQGGEPFRPLPAAKLVTSQALARLGYPMLGLWQPVRLKAAGPLLLRNLRIETLALDGQGAKVRVEAEVESVVKDKLEGELVGTIRREGLDKPGWPVRAKFQVEGMATARVSVEALLDGDDATWNVPAAADGAGARLAFHRLDAAVELANGAVSDLASVRFGIRTVELDTSVAQARLRINGAPVDLRGAVWMPLDALLRPDPARCKALLERARECGLNTLRVWGGGLAETDAFYDLCDAMGFLVIQELPLTADGQGAADDYLRNCADIIRRLRRHPSLIAWGIGGADPRLVADAAALCRDLDPERQLLADSPTAGPSQLWATRSDPQAHRVHWLGASLHYVGGVASPSNPSTLFARLGGEPGWPPADDEAVGLLACPAAAAFGPSSSAREQILKAQMAQATALQRRVERRGLAAESEVLWQLNEPMPSDSAAFVDASDVPKPAWYVLRRGAPPLFADVGREMPTTLAAGEPLRGEVCVAARPANGLTVSATFLDRALRPLASWQAAAETTNGELARPLAFEWAPDASLVGDVCFLLLRLEDAAGTALASNLYWFGVVAPRGEAAEPRLRVAWLTGRPAGPLADEAFLAATGIQVTRPERKAATGLDERPGLALEDFDAIVVDARTLFDDYTDDDLKAVAGAVARGCGLLIEGLDSALSDSSLSDLLPLARPLPAMGAPAGEAPVEPLRPAARAADHPVVARLSFAFCPRLPLGEALEASERGSVLVELDPEHPLLAESRHGKGRVLLLAPRPSAGLAAWGELGRFYAAMLGYLGRLPHRELGELVEAARPAPLRALARLEPATVETEARQEGDAVAVTLTNTSQSLALALHLEAVADEAPAAQAAPFTFSDNYIWLLPGEARVLRVQARAGVEMAGPAARAFELVARGWNVPPEKVRGTLQLQRGGLRLGGR